MPRHVRRPSRHWGYQLVAGILLATAGNTSATARDATVLSSDLNGALETGYQLAAGDKLRVTVFGEPSLTGAYEIGADGELSLPLIEGITAGGKTPKSLAAIIAEKLKAGGYVLVPKVAVEVTEHRPFYILGEVKQPGEYPYSGNMTLEQAVARAGGFTPRANRKTITLRRQDWSAARKVRLEGPALKIAPGDTIMVRESFF